MAPSLEEMRNRFRGPSRPENTPEDPDALGHPRDAGTPPGANHGEVDADLDRLSEVLADSLPDPSSPTLPTDSDEVFRMCFLAPGKARAYKGWTISLSSNLMNYYKIRTTWGSADYASEVTRQEMIGQQTLWSGIISLDTARDMILVALKKRLGRGYDLILGSTYVAKIEKIESGIGNPARRLIRATTKARFA